MNIIKFYSTLIFCTIFLTIAATAVPKMISYQGRLTEAEDAPVTGMYSMKFTIYDADVSGNELWSSDGFVGVNVQEGLFSHVLEESIFLPDSLVKYDSLWLGVTIYKRMSK